MCEKTRFSRSAPSGKLCPDAATHNEIHKRCHLIVTFWTIQHSHRVGAVAVVFTADRQRARPALDGHPH